VAGEILAITEDELRRALALMLIESISASSIEDAIDYVRVLAAEYPKVNEIRALRNVCDIVQSTRALLEKVDVDVSDANLREAMREKYRRILGLYEEEIAETKTYLGYVISSSGLDAGKAKTLEKEAEEFKRKIIVSILRQTDWNVIEAARILRIDPKSLGMELERLGIREAPEDRA